MTAKPVEIACLLPVRNGAADLPGYLESAARVCDAVVALDDGSTDETRDILEASPLVAVTLSNPRRETFRGWHDGRNRNRLLEAAADLQPGWILSLDADERMDTEDAEALRRFVRSEALRGPAYGLRHFRMWGDDRYEPTPTWIYRLFAWEPGMELPNDRLHPHPVPTSIPRAAWVRTTIRVRHLGAADDERLAARLEKYREADPAGEYSVDFGGLGHVPEGELPRWTRRPADLPVLDPEHAPERLETAEPDPLADEEVDLEGPVLSAIVISRNDEATIERSVRSVAEQECSQPFEVIVVTSGTDRTAAIVRERFPEVRVVELDCPALPGEARNAGLREARGDYVSFPGSHVELPPGSLEARLQAHERGYAMVTGTTLNGTRTCAGWASYFLDHSGVLPGRPSTELEGAPAHCSYHREHLLRVGAFPEGLRAGEDTIVNRELARRGLSAYRAQDVRLVHNSPCRTPGKLVRHHFARGRGFGRILLRDHRHSGRMLTPGFARALGPGYVRRRLARTGSDVRRWGGPLRRAYRLSLPLVMAGALAAWAGAWYEILRPERGKRRVLLGRPGATLLLAGVDGWSAGAEPWDRWGGRADAVMLARVDFVERWVRIVNVPRTLLVDIPGAGHGMLNTASAVGRWKHPDDPHAGPRLLRTTLEHALQIPIDDHVAVGFNGFRRVIDLLGGIDVDIPEAIDDASGGFFAHFPAGRQRLDGERALDYARTRKADSQRHRENRHLQVLLAIARRAAGVRSPLRLARVAREMRRSVVTSVSPARALVLARAVLGPPPAPVSLASMPAELLRHRLLDEGRWAEEADLASYGRATAEALGLSPAPRLGSAHRDAFRAAAADIASANGAAPAAYSGPLARRDGQPMRPDVAEAFDRMAAALREETEIELMVNSGFRSDAEQARIFATRPDPDWVAPPGESYHRYGTELDLGPPPAWTWLAKNAERYGFHRRYASEPWHYGYGPLPGPATQAAVEPGVSGA